MNPSVEKLWDTGRVRANALRDRRRPSPGIAAVLAAMAEAGPLHGSALARMAGQKQNNVTTLWLPSLDRFGFVWPVDEVAGLGHQGGGRPAVIWALTAKGRQLAAALRAELVSA